MHLSLKFRNMKKVLLLSCSVIFFYSCKNDSKENRLQDADPMEIPATQDENETNPTIKDTISVEKTVEKVETSQVNKDAAENTFNKKDYASFGANFTPTTVLNREQMLKKYKNLKPGDTISVAFESQINEVCKKKGCWMDVSLGKDQKSFVKFKDYGFFVPLNADKSDAIIRGKAFIDEVSVAQLKHYAKDGGKSQEEIDKINSPKVTYAFQADGVMIKR